jgi:hypothetical protein
MKFLNRPLRNLAITAFGAAVLASTALAQTPAPEALATKQEQRVDNRQERQSDRITQGVEAGQITAREQVHLERQQRHINRLEARTEAEREPLLELIRHRVGAEWPRVEAGIARAIAEIGEKGFCISIGEWQSDIHGVGVPLRLPDGRDPYALVMGGPAYLMPAKRLIRDFAPRLAQVAAQLIQGGTAR